MIKNNLGKILLICNMVIVTLLLTTVIFDMFRLDAEILIVTQFALAGTAIMVFYTVMQTYKLFKEIDICVGTIGFGFIAFSYMVVAMLSGIRTGGPEVEAALNITIGIGYLLVTLAAGWLKSDKKWH